jgi:hypothetical protein
MLRDACTLLAVSLLLCTLLLSGCGPSKGTVSGTVAMDGQPLAKGTISFNPAAGTEPPVTADIAGGKYSAEMIAGKKIVQISAQVVVGQRKSPSAPPEVPPEDIYEERLPPMYNSDSKLELDVKPGSNAKDWDTKSKPK